MSHANELPYRQHYRRAATAYVAVVAAIPPGSWELPALGVWTVRDLAGHASRALLTVESYLDPTATVTAPDVPGPLDYYRAVTATLADPASVADRGRQAGAALGADPAVAAASIADRVLALVAASDDDAQVRTPVGTMSLAGYLPTRTFELVVHSLDLAAAVGVDVPAQLAEPAEACLALAAELAAAQGRAAEVLLALTGRRPLPDAFSIL
jgi:uncharacterized protein (TIGR03083 family)